MSGVELVFGPMLIGVFLNTIFYGVVLVQCFIYYRTYRQDAPWIRYFVLFLFICETMNTGFDIGMMYEPLIIRYATPRAAIRVPIMLSADPIMTVIISTPVQLFIAWRIKIISGSKLLTSIICFFAICSFIGGIATTVSVTVIPEYARLQEFDGAVITWLASSAVADICITASLVWSLHRRRTGHSPTDDIINRIIRLTLQTGAITAVSATLDVVVFLAVPHTTLNFIWDFALGKLYTNSLLSTLNARAGWENLNGTRVQDNVLFGMNSMEFAAASGSRRTHGRSGLSNKDSGYSSTAIELRVPQSNKRTPESSVIATMKEEHELEAGVASTRFVEAVGERPAHESDVGLGRGRDKF